MKQAGDHALLRAARKDPEAFGKLAERQRPALRAWAYPQTRDLATANDVSAETLARAWIHRRRYRGGDEGAARAPVDAVDQLDEQLAARQQAEDLWPLVDDLLPAQRDALRLRVIDELSYTEAAERLGRSDGATRILSRTAKP